MGKITMNEDNFLNTEQKNNYFFLQINVKIVY